MLAAALEIVEAAGGRGIPLRLVGGLAVQALCPDFPPRTRDGQDLDLATTAQARKALTGHLEGAGFQADRHFNALYGHKQPFFRSEERGPTLDVVVDRLEMWHTLAELVTRHTPPGAHHDPRARVLHAAATEGQKSRRWRMRAKVGERKRWYELPEETPHPD
jgi:hypothetical protein